MLTVKFRGFNHGEDLERLYEFMMREENQILFSHAFHINTLQNFEKWLVTKLSNGFYHDFFMIENENGDTVGFTFSYEFFPHDGHCKFTLCLYEAFRQKGYGAIASVKMMDYLFRKYPLRQIFISVFNYNESSLAANRKAGFEEVAVLPEYRFTNGAYYDLHILTMPRETFYAKARRFLKSPTEEP